LGQQSRDAKSCNKLTLDAASQYRRADGRFASRTEIYAFQSSQPCVKEPTGPKDLVALMTGISPTNPAPAVDELSLKQLAVPAAQEDQLNFSPNMVAAIIATLKAAGISSPRTPTETRAPRPKALEPVKFTGKGKPEENIRWLDTVTRYFALFVLQLFASRDCWPDARSRGKACAALRVATRLLRARRDPYG
jgi:hypothetical protein